jgi:hypothetical protein
MLTGCWQDWDRTHDYTNYCLYKVDPPDDEQQACSKHVVDYYCNKLIENSAIHKENPTRCDSVSKFYFIFI